MKKLFLNLIFIVVVQPAFASDASRADSDSSFTLYRTSTATNGDTMRIHIATFDAAYGVEYNQENCEIAQRLFLAQPAVTVRYWCERGYYNDK